jgi:hypothetical protein
MLLPDKIGNGCAHDDDDDDETRGASLYLEEATDVSYSEEGIEMPLEQPPALVIIHPDIEDDDDDNSRRQNFMLPLQSRFNINSTSRKNNSQKAGKGQSSSISWIRPRISPDTNTNTPSKMATSDNINRSSGPASGADFRTYSTYVCRPYKIEQIRQQVVNNSPGVGRRTAIVSTLKEMGIKVFVLDGRVIANSYSLLTNVKRVIQIVSRDNYNYSDKRCLLYQDEFGRLFNVVLSPHTIGPASSYEEYLSTYSGCQAMVALAVLCRSFPCIASGM